MLGLCLKHQRWRRPNDLQRSLDATAHQLHQRYPACSFLRAPLLLPPAARMATAPQPLLRFEFDDRLLMQRAKRPQDTGRGDSCWTTIVDRAPNPRMPWLQYAVRSLRPCHQAHLERSSGGLRGRLRHRRWQAFARKDAVYAETGRTFD